MKKKLTKQIRQIANQLPKESYTAGYSGRYGFVRMAFAVNHYRRLKRLIAAGNVQAAREYIFSRNQNVTF